MTTVASTGSPETILVIIRGNSGSGKSSVARAVRCRYGRGCALVEQDHLRRIVLRERDTPGGLAPGLIEMTVRFCLDHSYHVVLEGILFAAKYRDMLLRLCAAHLGTTCCYYLDVPLAETLRRHTLRPEASQFTAEQMRGWYLPDDRLGLAGELVVPYTFTLEQTVDLIATHSGLGCGRTPDPRTGPPATTRPAGVDQ